MAQRRSFDPETRASEAGRSFLHHRRLHSRLRQQARTALAGVSVSADDRLEMDFGETPEAQSLIDEVGALAVRRHVAPVERSDTPPPMSIVMLVVGTRGDVQPFIGIGQRLQRDGHRVRLATHAGFREFVESNGLEFYPLGGDPVELIAYMVRTGGKLLPTRLDQLIDDVPKKRRMLAEIIESTWGACTRPDPDAAEAEPFTADAIISNPPAYGHVHVAEALRVPLQMIFTMPWSPTTAFPHPMANLDFARPGRVHNWLSYGVVDALTWAGTGDLINDFRKQTLGLEPIRPGQGGSGLLNDAVVPFTYLWSPSLIPKPDDWKEHIDIADFVFLEQQSGYQPPDDLVAFLDAGDPPIYVGFGSCVVEDPEGLTRTIFSALESAGRRGIVSAGWGGLGDAAAPEHVYLIGDCPHDWLFPRCAAVCHHGGAGTTAAGLRAGRPGVVVPFFGDQPFWGAMIARAGAGPEPVPIKEMSVERLAAAFRACDDDAVRARAGEIGDTLAKRDGADLAVQAFYRHLPSTAEGIAAWFGFDAEQRQAILEGEVVIRAEDPADRTQLGFAAAARLEAPMRAVYDASLSGETIRRHPRVLAMGELPAEGDPGKADLSALRLGPEHADDVAALLQARPGDDFNLSREEISVFAELGRRFDPQQVGEDAITAVEAAWRDILAARFRAYRERGLAGIAPYARGGGEETRPDDALRAALPPDGLLAKEFPELQRTLLDYPDSAPGVEHRFFWTVHEIQEQPALTLVHRALLHAGDIAVVETRLYYLSRGLDALHLGVGLLPTGDGSTLAVCTHHSVSGKLRGFGGSRRARRLEAEIQEQFERLVGALRGAIAADRAAGKLD